MDVFLDVLNIDENNFSIDYLLIWQNGDAKCHIIECSRIKEGVYELKNLVAQNVLWYRGVV